jgi:hypothetical protein
LGLFTSELQELSAPITPPKFSVDGTKFVKLEADWLVEASSGKMNFNLGFFFA